jgi:uncharacterized RDD family membrane protein YckC
VTTTAYGDPIVTGEAVAVELRPAGIGSRAIALVIDQAAQLVLLLLLVWAAAATAGETADTAAAAALILTLFVGVILGYPVGFEALWRGRTPGKAVMGLRVVRDDGGPIRFRHAFVRGLVGVVVDRPGLSAGLLALVPMLATARSKRLGDLAAGTVVVQERVPARIPPPPPMPPQLAGWAAGLDLSQLTDDLAMELRHFLGRAGQLAPWARDEMGRRLHDELVTRTGPPPAGAPAWAYFSAVLAERRRREIERLTPAALPGPPGPPAPPAPGPVQLSPAAPPPAQPPTEPGPFAPPR